MALTGGLFDGVDDTPFLRARLRELARTPTCFATALPGSRATAGRARDALEDAYASEASRSPFAPSTAASTTPSATRWGRRCWRDSSAR